jgi:drug/metabolite transporter (DMT)-like permease
MSVAFALLLALTWVVSDLAVRSAGPDVTAAGRSFFSCLGLCLLAGRSPAVARRSWAMIKTRPGTLLISGLLGVSVYALFSLQAIALVGVSLPNLLLATTPCLSMILGMLWFGKVGSRPAYLGIALATTGAAVYVLGSFTIKGDLATGSLILGVGAALVAVVSIAVYGQHYAKISQGHDPLDLLPGIFGSGTVLLLVLLAVTGRLSELWSLSAETLALLVILGIVIYVPVYVLQHRLIHLRGAVYMASVSLLVPFGVRAAEMLLGGPAPGLVELVGMGTCVVGVYFVVRHPLRDR